MLTFVGSFVPFAGPIIAGAVAGAGGAGAFDVTDALLIVGAALLIQVLAGNVLQPFILGKATQLHPSLILAAVTGRAIVAGLAGASSQCR